MLRFCLIGDSHLACLKAGWDETPEPRKSSVSVTYFGAQSQLFEDLRIEGKSLASTSELVKMKMASTSNGKTSIEVEDYDFFIVVGLGFNLRRLVVGPLSRYRTIKYNARRGNTFYVSESCLLESAIGIFKDSLAVRTAQKLKAAGAKRIALVPQPLPSSSILELTEEGKPFRQFQQHADGDEIYRLFYEAGMSLAKSQGLEFIEQPPQTRLDGFFSKPEYSVGSVRLTENLDVPHSSQDFGHMNSRYGAEVWQSLLEGRM